MNTVEMQEKIAELTKKIQELEEEQKQHPKTGTAAKQKEQKQRILNTLALMKKRNFRIFRRV